MVKHGIKKKIIKGEKLKELRTKIINVAEVHPKDTPVDIAKKILQGQNAPKKANKDSVIRLVRRTLKNKGLDGRKSNGAKRSVRTPRFLRVVKDMVLNKNVDFFINRSNIEKCLKGCEFGPFPASKQK